MLSRQVQQSGRIEIHVLELSHKILLKVDTDIPMVDIIFVIDDSGSMNGFQNMVETNISNFIDTLSGQIIVKVGLRIVSDLQPRGSSVMFITTACGKR